MLKLLFFLCIASLSLGQLVVLRRSDTGGLNLFDLVVLAFALYGTMLFFAKRSFMLPKTLMFYLFFVVFAGVVTLPNFFALSADEISGAVFYLPKKPMVLALRACESRSSRELCSFLTHRVTIRWAVE